MFREDENQNLVSFSALSFSRRSEARPECLGRRCQFLIKIGQDPCQQPIVMYRTYRYRTYSHGFIIIQPCCVWRRVGGSTCYLSLTELRVLKCRRTLICPDSASSHNFFALIAIPVFWQVLRCHASIFATRNQRGQSFETKAAWSRAFFGSIWKRLKPDVLVGSTSGSDTTF